MSEILAALSHALDLTEGQPEGHTVRTCIVGMRIADELGLESFQKTALYNALLLKDAGCSSNASHMSALFGSDDRSIKPRMKFVDWQKPVSLAVETAKAVGNGMGLGARVAHFMEIARTENVTRTLIQLRCERGAGIARRLGFTTDTATAIGSLDEHWNGGGYPAGLKHEEIPLLSRIILLAQTLEAFQRERGVPSAIAVVRERAGTWFDPRLVQIVLPWKKDRSWWEQLNGPDATEAASVLEPSTVTRLVDETGLDTVASAFAEIIDAKSPYTFQHSSRVAGFASAMASHMGYNAGNVRRIRRAALLHDIGKLGVSSRILDKPKGLTDAEREEVRRHPVYTWEILRRVSAFSDFAHTAATHHEKLDGSGYPWAIRADKLDGPARILCVADIYEALTADRPYRSGMSRDSALAIIASERGTRLCPEAVDALAECTRETNLSAHA